MKYYFIIIKTDEKIEVKDSSLIKYLERVGVKNAPLYNYLSNKIDMWEIGRQYGFMELCDLANKLHSISSEWYETPVVIFIEEKKDYYDKNRRHK